MANEMDRPPASILGIFVALLLGSGIVSLAYGVFLLLRYIAIEYNYGVFNLYTTSIVLIAIGGLLIVTVLIGTIGALRNHASLRLVALLLAILLFIALAVMGVWTMVIYKTGQLQRSVEMDIKRLNEKYKDLDPMFKKKADYLNKHYNCCGTYALRDGYVNADAEGLPESCCIVPGTGCGQNPLQDKSKYFEKGCASVYYETKSKTVFQLSIVTLALAGAVLLGIFLYGFIFQRARGYSAVSRGI